VATLPAMTMTDLPHPTVDRSRLLRTAGAGALLAGLSYALMPVLVFTLLAEENPDVAAGKLAVQWVGAVELAVFAGLAAGTAILVLSVDALLRHPFLRATGLLSAAAWLFVGGQTFANAASGANLAEAAPALADQQVADHAVSVVITGSVAVAALTAAGWLLGLATAGRNAGIVGLPGTVVAVAATVVMIGPIVAWQVPFGAVALIPAYLVLGVILLRRARTAARRADLTTG